MILFNNPTLSTYQWLELNIAGQQCLDFAFSHMKIHVQKNVFRCLSSFNFYKLAKVSSSEIVIMSKSHLLSW